MNIRSLGFRTDVMVRVAEGGQVEDRGDHLVVRSPANPGYWWGNFLLVSQLRAGDGPEWLSRFSTEFPGAAHVAIGVDAVDSNELDPKVLTDCGLSLERSAVLTTVALQPPPHVNNEADIRPLSSDDDWQQAAALYAAVNAGTPGDDPDFIAARIRTRRAATAAARGTWFGAFIGPALMADLGVFTDPVSGLVRYQDVGTHPAARRQGLAGTMVWQVGRQLLGTESTRRLVIVADPADVAIGIYESVGFTVQQSQFSFQRV